MAPFRAMLARPHRAGAMDLENALSIVTEGCLVVVPPDYSGVAMAATRSLVRRRVGSLRLLNLPQSGIQTDLMIGAGLVAEIETSAVSLGEAGPAPRFAAAVEAGSIRVREATCPALHASLQAAERGVPFMPLRGLIGSDILALRPDWRVIANPLAPAGIEDPIVLLPAIRPDVALFHAPLADRHGNVQIGRRRELATMAHAATATIVTVERIVDGDLLADEATAAGFLPARYVSAVVACPNGAWPLPLPGVHGADTAHLAEYARLARTPAGFSDYLRNYVDAEPSARV
ncbi:MAG: CoA-transferase [Hyphomicrobiaceae bacterium]